jgi:DNA sulfur modification protein DndB
MITAKENVDLLDDLLYVHLAASSKEAIKRARKEFRQIRGSQYPINEDELQKNLTPHTEKREAVPELVSATEPAGAEEPAEA